MTQRSVSELCLCVAQYLKDLERPQVLILLKRELETASVQFYVVKRSRVCYMQ